MNKPQKVIRSTSKVFKVFCEGDTEYNYIDAFRKEKRLKISLKTINMEGGGYSNFLVQLRQDGNTNCLAKFIIVDGDRAFNDQNELAKFMELFNYCNIQNVSGRIPHVLIIDYPDFEYVSCLHSPKYKGQDVGQFIEKEYGYNSVNSFKADSRVFYFLNSKDRSYRVMLSLFIMLHYINLGICLEMLPELGTMVKS